VILALALWLLAVTVLAAACVIRLWLWIGELQKELRAAIKAQAKETDDLALRVYECPSREHAACAGMMGHEPKLLSWELNGSYYDCKFVCARCFLKWERGGTWKDFRPQEQKAMRAVLGPEPDRAGNDDGDGAA